MTGEVVERVFGRAIRVGDDILVLGHWRRVERLRPYRHPAIQTPARIAEWRQEQDRVTGMTIFDTDLIDRAPLA